MSCSAAAVGCSTSCPQRTDLELTGLSQTGSVAHLEYRVLR